MKIALIAAMTDSRVIGKDNQLPWHLPEDMEHFKRMTTGHTVIMGRKTFASLKNRPLPKRRNIVLSREPNFKPVGVEVAGSLGKALQLAKGDGQENSEQEIFIIGGENVFTQAVPIADRVYLTVIHHEYDGDTHFPKLDLDEKFRIVASETRESRAAEKLKYTFLTIERQDDAGLAKSAE
jgi:dihydrofolate reductase